MFDIETINVPIFLISRETKKWALLNKSIILQEQELGARKDSFFLHYFIATNVMSNSWTRLLYRELCWRRYSVSSIRSCSCSYQS